MSPFWCSHILHWCAVWGQSVSDPYMVSLSFCFQARVALQRKWLHCPLKHFCIPDHHPSPDGRIQALTEWCQTHVCMTLERFTGSTASYWILWNNLWCPTLKGGKCWHMKRWKKVFLLAWDTCRCEQHLWILSMVSKLGHYAPLSWLTGSVACDWSPFWLNHHGCDTANS